MVGIVGVHGAGSQSETLTALVCVCYVQTGLCVCPWYVQVFLCGGGVGVYEGAFEDNSVVYI